MRIAWIFLLVSTGCAQVLGLDSPGLTRTVDGGGGGDAAGPGDGVAARCKGDNFDDELLDPSEWSPFTEAMTQVVEKSMQLELYIDNTNGSAYCGLDAQTRLATTDTGVQLQIIQPSPDNASEVALVLRQGNANQLIFGKAGSDLQAIVKTNGADNSKSEPWSVDQHRFLRIERDFGNAVTFSTSADGSVWAPMWSTTASFASQDLQPQIYAGHYMQVPSATVAVDNFVVLAPGCVP
ncbi:MAG TPA: hypothetical protein VL326_18425 [Kofleriaceae bacterium]|nr:hypothetical protein [Kofleriaceae bacterium]